MYVLFINISVRNWHFATEEGTRMRFLIEPVYCMTWIWTLHRAHNKSKSPIEEDNIWANTLIAVRKAIFIPTPGCDLTYCTDLRKFVFLPQCMKYCKILIFKLKKYLVNAN